MPKFQLSLFTLTALLLISVSTASFAQTNSDGDETNGTGGDVGSSSSDPEPSSITPGLSQPPVASNKSIVASLRSATRYCTPMVQSEYVIDCLAERLSTLSKQLEGQEGFEEVQAILDSTANDLNRVARQNRSSTLAPATFATTGQQEHIQTTRRLIPVDATKMDNAVSQALAIIEETETLLLRSADDSANRSIQFQQIAAAVGSNKVLLRSL